MNIHNMHRAVYPTKREQEWVLVELPMVAEITNGTLVIQEIMLIVEDVVIFLVVAVEVPALVVEVTVTVLRAAKAL